MKQQTGAPISTYRLMPKCRFCSEKTILHSLPSNMAMQHVTYFTSCLFYWSLRDVYTPSMSFHVRLPPLRLWIGGLPFWSPKTWGRFRNHLDAWISYPFFRSLNLLEFRKDHLDAAKEDLKTWQRALKKLKEGACDFLGRKMIQ